MAKRKIQRKIRTPVELFFYRLRYRIGEHALRALVGVLPWVPYRLLVLFTSFWAWVTFGLLWRYRRRMLENVSAALGAEITRPAARKALIWQAWQNFARGVLETCAVMHFSREEIRSTIALEGEEHLKGALARGKGVLALSAHLGGFTLIGARLAASGYPFSAVVKQPGEEQFARYLDNLRAQIGVRTISAKPRKEAVRGIFKSLAPKPRRLGHCRRIQVGRRDGRLLGANLARAAWSGDLGAAHRRGNVANVCHAWARWLPASLHWT